MIEPFDSPHQQINADFYHFLAGFAFLSAAILSLFEGLGLVYWQSTTLHILLISGILSAFIGTLFIMIPSIAKNVNVDQRLIDISFVFFLVGSLFLFIFFLLRQWDAEHPFYNLSFYIGIIFVSVPLGYLCLILLLQLRVSPKKMVKNLIFRYMIVAVFSVLLATWISIFSLNIGSSMTFNMFKALHVEFGIFGGLSILIVILYYLRYFTVINPKIRPNQMSFLFTAVLLTSILFITRDFFGTSGFLYIAVIQILTWIAALTFIINTVWIPKKQPLIKTLENEKITRYYIILAAIFFFIAANFKIIYSLMNWQNMDTISLFSFTLSHTEILQLYEVLLIRGWLLVGVIGITFIYIKARNEKLQVWILLFACLYFIFTVFATLFEVTIPLGMGDNLSVFNISSQIMFLIMVSLFLSVIIKSYIVQPENGIIQQKLK